MAELLKQQRFWLHSIFRVYKVQCLSLIFCFLVFHYKNFCNPAEDKGLFDQN